ncbi:bifunctional 4-hydroxy-2-oxoglutarate aldolase/2-dehydro-3-deoxy-phosphogluconate aldolase [Micromonospora sp. M12]
MPGTSASTWWRFRWPPPTRCRRCGCRPGGAERDRIVGAGTVLDVDQVAAAADAGAQFTVAPGLDLTVADAAAARPAAPARCGHPTEAQQALRHGLTWLKAFPAISLGPAWFKALAGPLPQLRFVATGGLDASNAEAFLQAGYEW